MKSSKLLLTLGLCMCIFAVTACGNKLAANPVTPSGSEVDSTDQGQLANQVPSSNDTAIVPVASYQEPIHLVFAGDTMMDDSVKEAVHKYGPDYPFKHVQSDIQKADYAIVNLETSVTTATNKDTNQRYNFKSDPSSLKGIKDAGFDMVSLGNNHVLDYKEQGLKDTLRYLDQYGLAHIGAGMNETEAFTFKTLKIKGQTVKIGAFSRFMPTTAWNATDDHGGVAGVYEQEKAIKAIEEQKKGADYMIVFIHWGVERHNRPEAWQRQFAKSMINAGADAIIGSHPHVLQGMEFYKGKPIAYSLGNFLFPDYVTGKTADTGLLQLTLKQEKIALAFQPYRIGDNQIVKGSAAYNAQQLRYLQNISFNVTTKGNNIISTVK